MKGGVWLYKDQRYSRDTESGIASQCKEMWHCLTILASDHFQPEYRVLACFWRHVQHQIPRKH